MIQDIYPKKFDNRYFPNAEPDENSCIMCFSGNTVLCDVNSDRLFPTVSQLKEPADMTYLFSVGDVKYFLAFDYATADENFSAVKIKKLRHEKYEMRDKLFALFTSYHLYKWYTSSRFCGECGGKTVPCTGERALLCTGCGELIYPRINPAVIVGIINGDSMLVTRYVKSRGVENDALVAGYMEIGETPEDTVRREVMEEVGLRVKNIRYYKSQPWGYSSGLLLGFFCDVDGNADIRLEETELSVAKWVSRSDIKGQSDDLSLTNEMMMFFKNQNS
ncbi:MAG: NAD(+) diphosphatase [Ruminococcus sp.]|nr:NAD(+) diphosphatase [Ruminococcus sp.]